MTSADFLQTIIAMPDDDAPRLVYADWLEENGEEERAEFIRVQCEIDRFQNHVWCSLEWPTDKVITDECNNTLCPKCGPLHSLQRRERELLETPAGTNFRLDCCYGFACDIQFRRGFVESITCTWHDWLAHHEAIRAATPLREVRLTDRPHIVFGSVHETIRENRQFRSTEYAAHWVTVVEGCRPETFNQAISISDKAAHFDSSVVQRALRLRDSVAAARTLEGYLAARWEGITFHLPASDIPTALRSVRDQFMRQA